jgi:hypothetical protein
MARLRCILKLVDRLNKIDVRRYKINRFVISSIKSYHTRLSYHFKTIK